MEVIAEFFYSRKTSLMTNQGKPIQILLVEDNPLDILMISECLRKWTTKNYLNVVEDGEQALAFLHSRGSFVGSPRPDVVLLDLNLPNTGGNNVNCFSDRVLERPQSFHPTGDR